MVIDVTRPGYHAGRTPGNKGRTYPAEVLTPGEVRRLLARCSQTSATGTRYRALITVMYRAGLRCSEALALHLKDVDLRVGSITVLHGKGDRRRTVGIDPGAARIVAVWLEYRSRLDLPGDAPLFCTLRGRPIPPSQIRTLLPRLARRAGITKRVHPHGLRHTHAFELMMEGVPMPVIQAQLGHASLATTDTYLSHIAPKQVIETIRERQWDLEG
jgi:site-specific recombinase XerD